MNDWAKSASKAKIGDSEAFGDLIRQFQSMAVGYAFSILGHFDQAQDAAQAAFIEAYQNMRNLQEAAAFPAWLRKIVFKHCDRLTRGKRLPTISLECVTESPTSVPGPHSSAVRRETQDAVLEAVRALPDDERSAAALFYIGGHSQSEVAQFLDVPVSTLKNRLTRARGILREELMSLVEDAMKQNAPDESFGGAVGARIENLRWTHRWLTHLGCLEGCMRHLGLDVSPAWLSAGAGYAFALRIHKELCPAGIIAWAPPASLQRNVGFATDLLAPGDEEPAKQQQIVWNAANKALSEGSPCIGFAMEAWQSYIVYGYDDDGYFYLPVHTGDGHFDKRKMAVEVPCVMTFVKRVEPANDETVVRDTLRFAVEYARNPEIAPGWGGDPEDFVAGLGGYDYWIESIQAGRADGHGMAFNAQVFAELRGLACGFLKEASGRLRMEREFAEAIRCYDSVAASLRELANLFPLPASPEHIAESDRKRAARECLAGARAAEELGLKELSALSERL